MGKHRTGTIKYHQKKIDEIRKKRSEAGKKGAEKRIEGLPKPKKGYHKNQKKNTKKPKTRYRSFIEYDFLKYIRVVFKWATDNYPDLNRPRIEFLLYLYGTGAFSKRQFHDYHKLLGMYHNKELDNLIDLGYVKVWRPKKGKEHALYTLTQKAKIMCAKMHKFSCGDSQIPLSEVSNDMMKEGKPRINRYYLDMIKKMNKDKASDE